MDRRSLRKGDGECPAGGPYIIRAALLGAVAGGGRFHAIARFQRTFSGTRGAAVILRAGCAFFKGEKSAHVRPASLSPSPSPSSVGLGCNGENALLNIKKVGFGIF